MKSVLAVKRWGTLPDVSAWKMSVAHGSFLFSLLFFGEEGGYHVCDCICPSVSSLEDQRTTSYIIPQVPFIVLFETGTLSALKLTS